jgi:uncharacterized sulfatase
MGGTAESDPAEAPPNIMLIVSDDHAWTDYSFMGHPHIRTPRLDRLAAEGLLFPRGYVTSSLCCPSLVSLITGRFPHQHRITSNDPPMPPAATRAAAYQDPIYRERREQMNALLDAVPTLPRWLAPRGYLSLQTGKWWQGHYRRGGFTHGMTEGDPLQGGRHGDAGLNIGRENLQPIFDIVALAREQRQPFFVWYAPMLPHSPHNPPERLLAKYRGQTNALFVARYWAMVEWFDETCGALVDHLDGLSLAQNTVVVYLADNGWIQTTDGDGFAPKSKQSPYDGGLRTPIILRWPGKIAPRRSAALASSVDIAPTLLRIAGIQPPPELPGIDLLDPAATERRRVVYGACFTHDAIDLENPARNVRWRWCIEDAWKLIVPDPSNEPLGRVELYDLERDPFETRNLAADAAARVGRLRGQLDSWWPAASALAPGRALDRQAAVDY